MTAAPMERRTGWATFAAIMLIIVGVINLVNGFDMLHHTSYFEDHTVFSSLRVWGWVFLIWGVIQIIGGWLVMANHPAGYLIGVLVASIGLVLWFFMVFSEPWAALIGAGACGAVLYGLTVGSEPDQ